MKVYQELDDCIESYMTNSDFKKVEPFNDQYQNIKDEDPIVLPAIYWELLEPLEWNLIGNKSQSAEATIRFHVAVKTLTTNKSGIHDFGQRALDRLTGKVFWDSDGNQLTTQLVRVRSSLPKRYAGLKVIQIDFKCQLFDCSLMPNPQQVNFTFNAGT